MMAAIVTMLSKKCPSRTFSLGLCWLLSKLTVGTASAGKPRAAMNGEIGTVPPDVRMRRGAAFHISVRASTTRRA